MALSNQERLIFYKTQTTKPTTTPRGLSHSRQGYKIPMKDIGDKVFYLIHIRSWLNSIEIPVTSMWSSSHQNVWSWNNIQLNLIMKFQFWNFGENEVTLFIAIAARSILSRSDSGWLFVWVSWYINICRLIPVYIYIYIYIYIVGQRFLFISPCLSE